MICYVILCGYWFDKGLCFIGEVMTWGWVCKVDVCEEVWMLIICMTCDVWV